MAFRTRTSPVGFFIPNVSVLQLVDIPSARAEDATYHANEILADFRARSAGLAPGSPEMRDLARDAIFRLVAVAEMFAAEHLVDRVENQLPGNELVMRIWEERLPRAVRDWPGRKSAWKQLFDVKWDYKAWNELNGFISARNIIAHGIGRLTRSQLRRGQVDPGLIQRLNAARLRLDGHRLLVDEADVDRCGTRVKHFIAWLDGVSKA